MRGVLRLLPSIHQQRRQEHPDSLSSGFAACTSRLRQPGFEMVSRENDRCITEANRSTATATQAKRCDSAGIRRIQTYAYAQFETASSPLTTP
jgi:hypothetical protein